MMNSLKYFDLNHTKVILDFFTSPNGEVVFKKRPHSVKYIKKFNGNETLQNEKVQVIK